MDASIQRHQEDIIGVLEGVDRMRFRGTTDQLRIQRRGIESLWRASTSLKGPICCLEVSLVGRYTGSVAM